jgi:hypothetical protein
MRAFVCCNPELASAFVTEAAREQQRATNFCPARVRKRAQDWADSIALCESHVIKVQRASRRHAVLRRQHDFSRKAADRSRRGRDDDFVQPVEDLVSSEDEHGPTLVRQPKRVPADQGERI